MKDIDFGTLSNNSSDEEGDDEYKREMKEASKKAYFQDDYMERMEKISSLN